MAGAGGIQSALDSFRHGAKKGNPGLSISKQESTSHTRSEQ